MSIQKESVMHLSNVIRKNVFSKNEASGIRKFAIKFSAYRIIFFGRILKHFYNPPVIMSSKETITYILEHKCSIGRVGDGEMDIMIGVWWKKTFQKYDRMLSKKLKDLKTTDQFLLCLPDTVDPQYLSQDYITKQEYDFWKTNIHQFAGYWRFLGSENEKIGNAFLSRFYIRYKDKTECDEYVSLLKQLWNNRDIILVEGEKTRSGVGNDLYINTKTIGRILCPAVNAFDYYEEILVACRKFAKPDCLFLLALGQTATVLAKDLSDEGFQALDIGHMDIEYEWFLAKTDVKMPVKNKYVKEALGGDNPEECDSDEYADQILIRLNPEE